jgi:hypothetical protein
MPAFGTLFLGGRNTQTAAEGQIWVIRFNSFSIGWFYPSSFGGWLENASSRQPPFQ